MKLLIGGFEARAIRMILLSCQVGSRFDSFLDHVVNELLVRTKQAKAKRQKQIC
jgi:hypothetical protein